jgi:diguanylate cyclase (GGDEF)-like protein
VHSMGTEILLIIILSMLVLLLGILYFARIRREKQQQTLIKKMDLVEFADFLRSNSVDGNIQAVAGKVSKLLTQTFGCEKIVFLRKKRGTLELNFYHGLAKFNRKDFHLKYEPRIGEEMSDNFLPMKIEKFKRIVSADYFKRLTGYGVDMFFPIYWRNNLYGIYFIKSNLEVRTPEFTLMVASLAQSLSAAYHIKWHESKLSSLEKKLESSVKQGKKVNLEGSVQTAGADLLHLVNIRKTNELVPKIIHCLSNELKLNNFRLVYEDDSNKDSLVSVSKGSKNVESEPEKEVLSRLYNKIEDRGVVSIERLQKTNPELSQWLTDLKSSHMDYVTEFRISHNHRGLLAFSGAKPSPSVKAKLKSYQRITSDLIENAEAYRRAEIMSYTDSLTELANQRYMYKRLTEEINRAERYSRPLAFIIFDIDELKVVNDTYGHLAGDELIRQVGQALKNSIRAIDVVARYGGDEFCVVMPESDEETCVKFMKRMMETIASTEIRITGQAKTHHCTISMGSALYPQHAKKAQKLVHAADMALLKAKSQGRNTYIVFSPEFAVTNG